MRPTQDDPSLSMRQVLPAKLLATVDDINPAALPIIRNNSQSLGSLR